MGRSLAVVGTSLVSPLGITAAEHAFFVRAGIGPAAPGGFLDAQGDTLAVAYCPWLGASVPLSARVRLLAERALDGVLELWGNRPAAERAPATERPVLLLCTSAERLDLGEAERAAIEKALGARAGVASTIRLSGAAGVFEGLRLAADLVAQGAPAVAVVAADSFISPRAIGVHRREDPGPWEAAPLRAAEGAAALLVTSAERARFEGLGVLGTIVGSETQAARSHDDNDELVDGSALTALIGALPSTGYATVVGPFSGGPLRRTEWDITVARQAAKLSPSFLALSLEAEIGTLGAAGGAADLVYGIAATVHRAWSEHEPVAGPMLVWAISRDGTRGLCAVDVAPPEGGAAVGAPVQPTRGTPHPVHVGMRERPAMVRPHPAPPHRSAPMTFDPTVALALAKEAPSSSAEDAAVERDVTIDAGRGAPGPLAGHYDEVLCSCLERMAVLARHRLVHPMRERATYEPFCLAQIDALAEIGAQPAEVVGWIERGGADEGEAGLYAALLALGSLAAPGSLEAVDALLRTMPVSADAATWAADALLAAPAPEIRGLVRDLLRAPAPLGHAVALEYLVRAGEPIAEHACSALSAQEPGLLVAALRALGRIDPKDAAKGADGALFKLVGHVDNEVAWQAARTLSLWGDSRPIEEVRLGAAFAKRLGVRSLELLVCCGRRKDLSLFQELAATVPVCGALLDALARFGHAEVWGFLVHHLRRPDLVDDAVAALHTLFGRLVPEADERQPKRWEEAIGDARLAPEARYRRGAPWSVDVVVSECLSGELSRVGVEQRLDEIGIRTGVRSNLELARFEPETGAALASLRALYVGARASGWD